MMVAASLCGATTATEFALFAENRKSALSQLIDYDSAPSHDTFSRLLRLMDPDAFARAFAVFAAGFSQALAEMEIGAGHGAPFTWWFRCSWPITTPRRQAVQ